MFKTPTPQLPAVPPQPMPAPPLEPAKQKPQAKGGQPSFLGAIAPTQQQTTAGTKTLLGQ